VWVCYSTLSLNQLGMSEISTCIQVTVKIMEITIMAFKTTIGTRTQLTTSVADLGSVFDGFMKVSFGN
jgi:hypothetical protein